MHYNIFVRNKNSTVPDIDIELQMPEHSLPSSTSLHPLCKSQLSAGNSRSPSLHSEAASSRSCRLTGGRM